MLRCREERRVLVMEYAMDLRKQVVQGMQIDGTWAEMQLENNPVLQPVLVVGTLVESSTHFIAGDFKEELEKHGVAAKR